MKDKVLVNVATYGREDYSTGQDRLIYNFHDSGWDGDYLMFSDKPRTHERGVEIVNTDGIRSHQQTPYAFKLDAIRKALDLGYKKIIWADSTILKLRPLDELFNTATIQGIVAFHNLGHDLHRYISDEAASRLSILSDPRFRTIKQIMACSIVFDFTNPICDYVFKEWYDASIEGLFENRSSVRPDFVAHRHDQAILSVLLWQYAIPLLPYGMLVYEPHNMTKEYGEPYLLNKGL